MLSDTRAAAFPATRWSVLRDMQHPVSEASRRQALHELCRTYWHPLYAFARGRGASPADAEDLTQSFFVHLLEKELFSRADPALGRLRSFLRHVFAQHMMNAARDAARQRRGGGVELLSIDVADAESRLLAESGEEQNFDRHWALALIAAAAGALEAEYAARGKAAHFSALRCFLEGEDTDSSYAQAGEALGISIPAARQEVYRMRLAYREHLRTTIADTLVHPSREDIEEELAALRRALAG